MVKKFEFYAEPFIEMVDELAKWEERPDVFRKLQISRNHFHNVTNRDRLSSSGNPYTCPVEWGVSLTKAVKDNDNLKYAWVKMLAEDCGGIFISFDDLEVLKGEESEKTLELFQRIIKSVTK